MPSIGRRLERLKEQMPAKWEEVPEPWPLEDQLEDVLDYLAFHWSLGPPAVCTDREINLLEAVEDLPEEVRGHVKRMDPKRQPEREAWLYATWRERKQEREERPERLKRQEEERRARHAESKRRDRELLERNRASVGLPPLTQEQIEKCGLLETGPPRERVTGW